MQLSARILTALAVLAFVVGVVVGAQNANHDVSAATGTIDALNVGTCTTTNADVFDPGDIDAVENLGDICTQLNAFYQQNELEDLIEVDKDNFYATYAHDPRTAAEAPRAILQDSDLIRISITDPGRDRRDPVLIPTKATLADPTGTVEGGNRNNGIRTTTGDVEEFNQMVPDNGTVTVAFDPETIVAEAIGVDNGDLPDFEQEIDFDLNTTAGGSRFSSSGTYEIIWERETADQGNFKPIAPDGVVRFFGRVDDGIAADAPGGDDVGGFGPFRDLTDVFVTLDEDVISGEVDEPPVMTLNISVPDSAQAAHGVEIQLIYYETSGIEFMIGGGTVRDTCSATPLHSEEPGSRAHQQAACTSDEMDNDAAYVIHAESDEDAAAAKRHLALVETGRFTGVFQGTLRLTDADGDGSSESDSNPMNWGLKKADATYDEKDRSTTAAVIGVGNGPVTIFYKDTDGQTRRFRIEIDITPPTISVDSPTHGGRSDDEKPSFIGTFNDSDSGLQADSFQLDIDNMDDADDENPVISIVSGVTAASEQEQVRRRQDYMSASPGYGTFGIVDLVDTENPTEDVLYKRAHVPGSGNSMNWKSIEADDFDDGAPDGEFNDEVEIDFDEFDDNFDAFNNAVDFQAVVRDLAGNVGFSDSQPTAPRFINALGEEDPSDRDPMGKKHNVLGVFSRHVVYIDELDPRIEQDSSVTGFYGLDGDDVPVRDRAAIMVVFDNSVNGDLIDTGTFTAELDEETALEIVDVNVDGKLVFLKLAEDLASDAMPTVGIAEGREVEDLAGNLLRWQEEGAQEFKVKDGILPVFTVTLSGGSGTGVGSESPSRLTSTAIDIAIESDEDITGSPKVAVVCSNIQWDNGDKKLSNYVGNRTGYRAVNGEQELNCGGADEPSDFRASASLARPGNNWVYAWRNTDADARHLNDGKVTVVVWAADRNSFVEHKDDFCVVDQMEDTANGDCHNFGSATAEFTLDSILISPLQADGSGGSVQPAPGTDVKEPRPFIFLDFAGESTSVTVNKLEVNGEDVLADLDSVGDNRFLYWPEDLAFGTHKVEFDARDAADNSPKGTTFEFDVTARDPFVIDLTAGWNAVSFPANPVDTALGAVFTEEAVDRVVGWNPLSAAGPWSIATRVDGVWTTSANFAPLTDVEIRYGYWVHSAAFVEQSVDLRGQIDRETGDAPAAIGITTVPGWNFVGVVDQDGDQTEDHFDKELRARDGDRNEIVDAEEYLGDFTRAYTWDPIANGYRALNDDDPMKIGQGIWVFFPDGTTVAP